MEEKMIYVAALKGEFTNAVFMDVAELSFEPALRKYCEENVCGNYDNNYACPPYCGTPKEMEEKAKKYKRALVLQSIRQVEDIMDAEQTMEVRKIHNQKMLNFIKEMAANDVKGLPIMAGPCALCVNCEQIKNRPCRFPEKLASCLSAYCINAEKMAKTCKIPYRCGKNQVAFFSMYLIDEVIS